MNRIPKQVKGPSTAAGPLQMSLRDRDRKRKAEVSPSKARPTDKRSALGVLTNRAVGGSNIPAVKGSTNPKSGLISTMIPLKTSNKNVDLKKNTQKVIKGEAGAENKLSKHDLENIKVGDENYSHQSKGLAASVAKKEQLIVKKEQIVQNLNAKNDRKTAEVKTRLPDGVIDVDAEGLDDQYQVSLYVFDIFEYYKRRESKFTVTKYLENQTELNKSMRAILVDWMVEVQENFELNHETLYLAVKLVDLYLSKVVTPISKNKLQLVGATALFLAAKYDEKSPPVIDDFCYICDDAYPQREVLQMEISMLKTLRYDIGCPLSYRFLRRYARVAKLEMDTLTLARYILEMSLTEYDLIDVSDSLIAAACLMLAFKIVGVENPWTPTLAYYSGYSKDDIFDLCHRLFKILQSPSFPPKTIKAKYSHKVFYEVAKIPLPSELTL